MSGANMPISGKKNERISSEGVNDAEKLQRWLSSKMNIADDEEPKDAFSPFPKSDALDFQKTWDLYEKTFKLPTPGEFLSMVADATNEPNQIKGEKPSIQNMNTRSPRNASGNKSSKSHSNTFEIVSKEVTKRRNVIVNRDNEGNEIEIEITSTVDGDSDEEYLEGGSAFDLSNEEFKDMTQDYLKEMMKCMLGNKTFEDFRVESVKNERYNKIHELLKDSSVDGKIINEDGSEAHNGQTSFGVDPQNATVFQDHLDKLSGLLGYEAAMTRIRGMNLPLDLPFPVAGSAGKAYPNNDIATMSESEILKLKKELPGFPFPGDEYDAAAKIARNREHVARDQSIKIQREQALKAQKANQQQMQQQLQKQLHQQQQQQYQQQHHHQQQQQHQQQKHVQRGDPSSSWMCKFCEYERVFGEKPVYLMRWYNNKVKRERQSQIPNNNNDKRKVHRNKNHQNAHHILT